MGDERTRKCDAKVERESKWCIARVPALVSTTLHTNQQLFYQILFLFFSANECECASRHSIGHFGRVLFTFSACVFGMTMACAHIHAAWVRRCLFAPEVYYFILLSFSQFVCLSIFFGGSEVFSSCTHTHTHAHVAQIRIARRMWIHVQDNNRGRARCEDAKCCTHTHTCEWIYLLLLSSTIIQPGNGTWWYWIIM